MKRVWEYIIPKYFFMALVVGIIVSFVYKPEDVVIVKHPTPYNSETTYKHASGDCYRYRSKPVTCTADATKYMIRD